MITIYYGTKNYRIGRTWGWMNENECNVYELMRKIDMNGGIYHIYDDSVDKPEKKDIFVKHLIKWCNKC